MSSAAGVAGRNPPPPPDLSSRRTTASVSTPSASPSVTAVAAAAARCSGVLPCRVGWNEMRGDERVKRRETDESREQMKNKEGEKREQ